MSITLSDIQRSLADSFFGGDVTISGAVIFAMMLAFVFAIFAKKSIFVPFVVALPVTMIGTMLGLVPSSLAILVALICVIVIAAKGKEVL